MSNGEIEPLSERELELVQLLGQGLSNREIAQALFISPNTVKVHLRNIYTKLRVGSRTEATMVALRQGLIEIELPEQEGAAEGGAATDAREAPPSQAAAELVADTTQPPLRLWQQVYVVASVLLVALGLWLIWPRTAQQTGPFPGPPASALGQTPGTASRWKALAQLSTPRRRLAVAAQSNRLYAIGGETSQAITGAVEIYAADTDDWSRGADKPSPAADIGATVLDGRVYVPGGVLADGTVSDSLQVYIPAQDGPGHWVTGAPMPRPMSAYASAAHGGAVYLFGGWDGASYSAEAFRYDPDADQWSVLDPMSAPRAFAGAGTVGDRIYVLGGYDGQVELDTCQAYDPLQDRWDTCPALNAPRGGVGVAVVGETLYVIGGGWKSYLVENEYLALAGDTPNWQTFSSPLLQEWRNLGVAANGTFIYAVGGWDGEFLAVNQAYRALFRVYLPSLEEQDNVIKQGNLQQGN
jgi:DNA-binding CsgD family transcriptional regulator/N-acetylneuraminic acid mutarotase